jgi:hypothetical protein
VRLSEKEVQLIISAFNSYSLEQGSQLYLFGSRTKDHLKGGDIDLLLTTPHLIAKKRLRAVSHYILSGLKENLGDQKIDLKIETHEGCSLDPFLKGITGEAVLIHQW